MRRIHYIAGSWQGVQRDSNKDGYHVISTGDYTLLLLFDGVSSSENAKAAVDTAIRFSEESHQIYYKNSNFSLSNFLEDMNICILRLRKDGTLTTCCAVYIPADENYALKFSHLGDSRIYGIRDHLILYTRDDSNPVMRHILTKCLGLQKLATDDFYEKKITESLQRILLCSDGFYELMEHEPEVFNRALNYPDLSMVKNYIQRVVPMQNGDDATYILADFGAK